jgi:hypothetical protein
MSKFCAIDEWDTVDVATEAACVMGAVGVAAPMAICFSIFMSGEASTQSLSPTDKSADKENAKPDSPLKKSSGPRNIMNCFDAPKPSWAI